MIPAGDSAPPNSLDDPPNATEVTVSLGGRTVRLSLRVTPAPNTSASVAPVCGTVQVLPDGSEADPATRDAVQADLNDGGSVRVRSFTAGMTVEGYLDAHGGFHVEVEREPGTENVLELAVCDPAGDELVRLALRVPSSGAGEQPVALRVPPQPDVFDAAWSQFTQLVRACLDLAATVADRTGRNREELFAHVYTQERYAEQARAANHPALYRECFDNLRQYAAYLERLRQDALPQPPPPRRPAEDEAREELDRFRKSLADVWKAARARGRTDLDARLAGVARQAQGLAQRVRTEAAAVLGDVRRLSGEVDRVRRELPDDAPDPPQGPDLLEGADGMQ